MLKNLFLNRTEAKNPGQSVLRELKVFSLFLFLLSFGIVAFAQPDWSLACCMVTSFGGYALLWYSLSGWSKNKHFYAAACWFCAIQILHLNWLFSDHYVGKGIWALCFCIGIITGSAFGFLSKIILSTNLSWMRLFLVAACWTLFEWSRLFLLSGYSWDPIGLCCTTAPWIDHNLSVVGIYGLSFWVLVSNLSLLRLYYHPNPRTYATTFGIILLPYVSGFLLYQQHQPKGSSSYYPTLLVQSALSLEERGWGDPSLRLSPQHQWEHIFALLQPYQHHDVHLIILPEGALSHTPYAPVLSAQEMSAALSTFFRVKVVFHYESVCHADIAHILSSLFHSTIIMGLNEYDASVSKAYNAAFMFDEDHTERYEKRVLLPIAEYFPFQWCQKYAKSWGIAHAFSKGTSAKVFIGKQHKPLGIAICYEETFGHLMRENRQQGAEILVSISNDDWYPYSRLPIVHYHHGRLRAIEQGIPQVRVCNTGVTCIIDSLGHTTAMVDYASPKERGKPTILYGEIPLHHYRTLYTLWGDWCILSICLGIGCLACYTLLRKKEPIL